MGGTAGYSIHLVLSKLDCDCATDRQRRQLARRNVVHLY